MDYTFSVFLNYYHTIFHRYGVEIRGPNLFDFSHLLIVFPSLNMVQNCKNWLNRKVTLSTLEKEFGLRMAVFKSRSLNIQAGCE